MKILFWNARGLGNSETRLVLEQLCVNHRPVFLLLSEPWILIDQFPVSVWKRLKLKVFALNDRGNLAPNLWGLCSENLNPHVLAASQQYISFSVVWQNQQISALLYM